MAAHILPAELGEVPGATRVEAERCDWLVACGIEPRSSIDDIVTLHRDFFQEQIGGFGLEVVEQRIVEPAGNAGKQ